MNYEGAECSQSNPSLGPFAVGSKSPRCRKVLVPPRKGPFPRSRVETRPKEGHRRYNRPGRYDASELADRIRSPLTTQHSPLTFLTYAFK